jgi:hypothetical protein
VNWESEAEIRGYKKFFSIADHASSAIASDPEIPYIREIHEILDLADPLETMGRSCLIQKLCASLYKSVLLCGQNVP